MRVQDEDGGDGESKRAKEVKRRPDDPPETEKGFEEHAREVEHAVGWDAEEERDADEGCEDEHRHEDDQDGRGDMRGAQAVCERLEDPAW